LAVHAQLREAKTAKDSIRKLDELIEGRIGSDAQEQDAQEFVRSVISGDRPDFTMHFHFGSSAHASSL
jgi:hypothetical protein